MSVAASSASSYIRRQGPRHINRHSSDEQRQHEFPLGLCRGGCNDDTECREGLYCFQRHLPNEPVPGCIGGEMDDSRTYYCTDVAPLPLGVVEASNMKEKQEEQASSSMFVPSPMRPAVVAPPPARTPMNPPTEPMQPSSLPTASPSSYPEQTTFLRSRPSQLPSFAPPPPEQEPPSVLGASSRQSNSANYYGKRIVDFLTCKVKLS